MRENKKEKGGKRKRKKGRRLRKRNGKTGVIRLNVKDNKLRESEASDGLHEEGGCSLIRRNHPEPFLIFSRKCQRERQISFLKMRKGRDRIKIEHMFDITAEDKIKESAGGLYIICRTDEGDKLPC